MSTFAQTGAAGSGNNSRMGYYRFMMYGDDHQRAEDLGSRDLRNDPLSISLNPFLLA